MGRVFVCPFLFRDNINGSYFFARFLAFFVTSVFFAFLVAFFDFDFFFVGAAVFTDLAAFDVFFFLADFEPCSILGMVTPLSFDRTVFTAVPIGLSPFADESPTIAPAIPLAAAIIGPPTSPPITAPAMPPAVCFDTCGRFDVFFFLLPIEFFTSFSKRNTVRRNH